MTREAELEATLELVAVAAIKMLDNMGKGREPSPRLAAALRSADGLLGYSVAEKIGASQMMVTAIKELELE